jgi:hypothetical protein
MVRTQWPVDDSLWMVGLGSSEQVRAVNILLALGLSTVVVWVCAHRLQAHWRLLRWAIRRPFHSCAACHARNSSVALWRWQGRSPCWLCAECAFGVKDFYEFPRSRRQPGAQIASRGEHVGRAANFWSAPAVGGDGRNRPRDQQTRVAVPPAVANRHRHGRHEAGQDVAQHALPLSGTHALPKQRLTSDNRAAAFRAASGCGVTGGRLTRVPVPPSVAARAKRLELHTHNVADRGAAF